MLSNSPMATIHDVAAHANVSPATVSRVLSRPNKVAELTRRRVLKSIAHLGYSPNASARSLRTLTTHKILVTVPDIANPFFSLILQGIEKAALQEGYAVVVGDLKHDSAREEMYAQMLLRREADGLIFLGHNLTKSLKSWIPQRQTLAPIVNGCEYSPSLGVPSAHIDNAAAARDAMDHLYGLGHRRIGVVTGPLTSPLSRDRLRGVQARARAVGAADTLTVTNGDFSIESGIAAAAQLLALAQPPTAIFCFSDEMAIGVMHYAARVGRQVPAEMSVVGFDNIRFAKYTRPALTTIDQPMLDIGRETVRLLLGVLSGTVTGPTSVTLPHKLEIRESTAPAPTP